MERELDPEFMLNGGSENAPMSTTTSLKVAVKYSASAAPTLMRLRTSSAMERGANGMNVLCLHFLSFCWGPTRGPPFFTVASAPPAPSYPYNPRQRFRYHPAQVRI